MPENEKPDRRAAQKVRYWTSIVDAADLLIRERQPTKFSVDDLAAKADVSRRTIFNHFVSLDDVIAAACTRELLKTIDTLEARAAASSFTSGSLPSLFDEITSMLRSADIPPAISFLSRALENLQEGERYPRRMVQEAFSRIADRLVDEAIRRHPDVARLDIELLVSTLLHATSLASRYWVEQTNAQLDDASLLRWSELLEHVMANVRKGYASGA
jgi:AcrR family transcriptional regulator